MKKIKIGLPRALTYYRYNVLWKTFFNTLGCKVIVSPETTKEIINLGINNSLNEYCLSYKIYIGHVVYLSKFCDFVLISQICNYGNKNQVCPILNNIYDCIKINISKKKLLEYNICYSKLRYELLGFIKIGLKITKNPFKIIYGYILGKIRQNKYNQERINETRNKLYKPNLKVLIIGQFYNINDKFITKFITNYLEEHDIIPIFSSCIDNNNALMFSEFFSNNQYLKFSKEMIGALYYYNHQIDGVIYISTNNCKIDQIINRLAMIRNRHLPSLNLEINDKINKDSIISKIDGFLSSIRRSL